MNVLSSHTPLLPPLSAIFDDKSTLYKSKLPTIQDILATQSARTIHPPPALHSSASTPSLNSYSLTSNTLERPLTLRPSLSFPVVPTMVHQTQLPVTQLDKKEAVKRSASAVTAAEHDTPFSESAAKIASKIKTTSSPTKDFAFISHSPATFPSQEPTIDNASLARRKRRRTSPNELAILNQEFHLVSTPGKAKRLEISKRVNMTEKAVQIWFQNKRQSIRRLRACEKEITELPPTPDTTINSSYTSESASETSRDMNHTILPTPDSPLVRSAQTTLSPLQSDSSDDIEVKIEAVETTSPTRKVEVKFEGYDRKPSFRLPLDKEIFLTPEKKPAERRPLAPINTNTLISPKARSANDAQCIQGLLSLRTAAH